MGKKKDAPDTVTDDTVAEKGKFQIEYSQGDEEITLSFHDAERRDHEYNRLVSTGHHGVRKVDAE